MSNTFSYVKYDEKSTADQLEQRNGVEAVEGYLPVVPDGPRTGESLVAHLKSLVTQLPEGRAKFQALQKLQDLESHYNEAIYYADSCRQLLEEYYMWTGKAIRDAQIARTGKVDELVERSNS